MQLWELEAQPPLGFLWQMHELAFARLLSYSFISYFIYRI